MWGGVRGVGRGHSPDGVETDAVIIQHDVETEGAHHDRMDVGGDCHWWGCGAG